MSKPILSYTKVIMEIWRRARVDSDSQNTIRSQEIHHESRIRNYIAFLDQLMKNSPWWAQTDQHKIEKGTRHVLNWLSVDKSRDKLGHEILPIQQGTFAVKYKFSIKCNSSFWSTQNADSKSVWHVKFLQRKQYLEPKNDLVVKMTTFSIEYKKWSCYTSFWSL